MGCMLLILWASLCATAIGRKNILYVILDDYSEIPGSRATPNIDKIKGEGVTFSKAYANFPQCGASRYSFLSGRYPFKTGFVGSSYVPLKSKADADIYSQIQFLPRVMKDNGYLVGITGKVFHSQSIPKSYYTRFGDQFPEGIPYRKPGCNNFCRCRGKSCTDYATKESAIQWIHDWKETKEPWVLFAGFVRPHTNIEYDMSIPDIQGRFKNYSHRTTPTLNLNPISTIKWGPGGKMGKLVDIRMKHYLSMVFTVDTYIGEILDAIKQTSQEDETLIIIHSDHGMHYGNGFNHFGKWTLLDEALHVPLILKIPNKSGGLINDDVKELVDIFPTVLEYAAINMTSRDMKLLDGRSLLQSSHKDFSIAMFPSCSKKGDARNSKRRRPCMTSKNGAQRINAIGYSVRTKSERITEWHRLKGSAKQCKKFKSFEECNNAENCMAMGVITTRTGGSDGKSRCMVRVDPEAVSFENSLIAAEYLKDQLPLRNCIPIGSKEQVPNCQTTPTLLGVFSKILEEDPCYDMSVFNFSACLIN